LRFAGHGQDRGDDVGVGAAAAQVAGDRPLDGVGVDALARAIEQRLARHQHPGGAVAALQRVVLDEGPLQARGLAVRGQALDGGDLAVLDVVGERHAARARDAVDEHRAGPAGAAVADQLAAGGVDRVAQELEQGRARGDLEGLGGAVEGEAQRRGAGADRRAVEGRCGFVVVAQLAARAVVPTPRKRLRRESRGVSLIVGDGITGGGGGLSFA
jgi:hypothetical protein